MGMLKGDLDNAGFYTLWFNAWHHADDDNLLTALLDSVVKEALPPGTRCRACGFTCACSSSGRDRT